MQTNWISNIFIIFLVASPLLKSIFVGISYLSFSTEKCERLTNRLVNISLYIDFFAFLLFLYFYNFSFHYQTHNVELSKLGETVLPIRFILSKLTFFSLFFTNTVLSIILKFSTVYLHQDKHYCRYFGLCYLLQFSLPLLILSDSISLFFIGWEILGITSVLLISFYSERPQTVKNSLRIFAIYKIADILLYFAFALLIFETKSYFLSDIVKLSDSSRSIFLLLTFLSILIKCGAAPVPWLPRSMEGPTPSSAIFYGSLATHVPLLFLLQVWNNYKVNPWAIGFILLISLPLLLMSSALARIQSDAKNSLAYTSIVQFILIILEITFNLEMLAIIHITTHSFYRGFQFIRTPSLLFEYHIVEGLKGKVFQKSGLHFEYLIPEKLRTKFYWLTFNEFHIIPLFFSWIDKLLGLKKQKRLNQRSHIVSINLIVWLSLLGIEYFCHSTISISSILLIVPWGISIGSIIGNFGLLRFVGVTALGILSLLVVLLFSEQFWTLTLTIEMLVFIFAVLSILIFRKSLDRYLPTIERKLGLLTFTILLWVVGVPGPGTYFIIEESIHHINQINAFTASGAFILLSLYALSVYRYFSVLETQRMLIPRSSK